MKAYLAAERDRAAPSCSPYVTDLQVARSLGFWGIGEVAANLENLLSERSPGLEGTAPEKLEKAYGRLY